MRVRGRERGRGGRGRVKLIKEKTEHGDNGVARPNQGEGDAGDGLGNYTRYDDKVF